MAAGVVMCLGFGSLQAQNHKIAYIEFQEIMQQMPEFKKANSEMETYGKSLQEELKTMNSEWEKKRADYQKNEKNMAEAIKELKQKEIYDLQNRIQAFQETAQDDVRKKETDLLKPIIEKAKKAISEVAKENGYAYVLDSSPGSPILYKPEGDNLIGLVRKKLGINDLGQPTTPPAPAKK
jgi:outer membrane protein